MMPDHLEIIVEWTGKADPATAQWFQDHGFSVMSMRKGLLLNAPTTVVESQFSVRLQDAVLPLKLPVPATQQSVVAALTILRPRQYTQNERK